MRVIRILLIGTYSSANKGDAAMQHTFMEEFLKRQPAAEISIASPFPIIDTTYYSCARILKSRRRNLPLATFYWLLLEVLRIVGLTPRYYPRSPELKAMLVSDIVVDMSGDMLTEDYGILICYSHFLPLLQAQALGCPTVILGQSIGPFRFMKRLARRILSRADAVTVRESVSLEYLKSLDPSIAPVQTSDLAFLLTPASTERAVVLLEKEGIPTSSRPRLGVSLSALLFNSINKRFEIQDGMSRINLFAEALDHMVEKMDVEILFIPHVFGPRPAADDRSAIGKVVERMQTAPFFLRGEYRAEELKAVIASCDAFVGCRMHANIAALDSHVPVLAIGYSHKTEGIFTDLGLAEWVLSYDSLTSSTLISSIERLFFEADSYRQQLRGKIPEVRARASKNIDVVIDAIKKYENRLSEWNVL